MALGVLAGLTVAQGAIPSAEKLLPEDTLLVVTAPDFTKLRTIFANSPQSQFWNDPAMKTFRDDFLTKWKDEFVTPLERELGIRFEDYVKLPQGQFTFALIQNESKGDFSPALLLLIDTKDKGSLLKTNLADLRKKWVDADKPLRTEKIRDIEFLTFGASGGELPKALTKLFSEPTPTFEGEATTEPEPKKPSGKYELVVGQFESLLIAGTSLKAVETVAVHLTGGAAPALADLAAYDANHAAMFRDAPLYGWANAKLLLNILGRSKETKSEPEPDFGPMGSFKPDKVITATGLAALKSIAATFRQNNEGSLLDVFLSVPESSRQGLFKLLVGEPKESTPPPFVPADAVKFQRWRLDGQKAWATLEKMMNDISPTAANLINFIIDTANTAAKDKDPDFDLRKNLIGNLGDDIISYEKAPRGTTAAELNSPPSLFLLGSPNPDQLAAALKGIFLILSQQGPPTEREFRGKKIYTVTIQNPSLSGMPEPGRPLTRTISYASARGYVAMTSDSSLLEEFLRTSENLPKALRDTTGLAEATAKVANTGTGLFNYENQTETMRVTFDALKKNPRTATNVTGNALAPLSAAMPGVAGSEKTIRSWMDFSLLPDFDRVSKYFHFSVTSVGANVEGLTVKVFAPTPPELKK